MHFEVQLNGIPVDPYGWEGIGNDPYQTLTGIANGKLWLQAPVVSVPNENSPIPNTFQLQQNYPNPFNPTATIEYHVLVSSFVKLSVYDILGREIAVLANEIKPVGKHRVTFDGSNLPAGVYFYRMQAGKFQETRKLILLK